MFEGSMKSTGWGFVGTEEKGFEWHFEPDSNDRNYAVNPVTGKPYGFCCCSSGYVYGSEQAAIRAGKRWMKECNRSGIITAVEPTAHRFEY